MRAYVLGFQEVDRTRIIRVTTMGTAMVSQGEGRDSVGGVLMPRQKGRTRRQPRRRGR